MFLAGEYSIDLIFNLLITSNILEIRNFRRNFYIYIILYKNSIIIIIARILPKKAAKSARENFFYC